MARLKITRILFRRLAKTTLEEFAGSWIAIIDSAIFRDYYHKVLNAHRDLGATQHAIGVNDQYTRRTGYGGNG